MVESTRGGKIVRTELVGRHATEMFSLDDMTLGGTAWLKPLGVRR